MGRVTKDQADALPEALRENATVPDPSMRKPRPVAWDWIDIGRDDQTPRIEFVQGIVERLHHVEVSEEEDEVRIIAFLGIDPNFRGGQSRLWVHVLDNGKHDGSDWFPTYHRRFRTLAVLPLVQGDVRSVA